MNVLLVEDNLADARLTLEAFRENAFQGSLHIVQNGEAALRYLQDREEGAGNPDLILLDLNMPGMGGKELLKIIRSEPEYQDIPVVVLTTSELEEDRRECIALDADGYYNKPAEWERFVGTIQEIENSLLKIIKESNLPSKGMAG